MAIYEIRNYRTGDDTWEFVTISSDDNSDIWTSYRFFNTENHPKVNPKQYHNKATAKIVRDILQAAREREYMQNYTHYKMHNIPKSKWTIYRIE